MRTGTSRALTGRIAFTIWLAASAGACTSWQAATVSPEQLITEKHPSDIRVTLKDRSRVELHQPALVGDTLVGSTDGEAVVTSGGGPGGMGAGGSMAEGRGTTERRIPLSQAAFIETRHVSAGKTTGLVLGVTAAGFVVVGAALMSSQEPMVLFHGGD
jgi:hypothetical protein